VAYEARSKWRPILRKFTSAREEEILVDEPLLVMKRNVQLNIESEINVCIYYSKIGQKLAPPFQFHYITFSQIIKQNTAYQNRQNTTLSCSSSHHPFPSSFLTLLYPIPSSLQFSLHHLVHRKIAIGARPSAKSA
jgi:hypothetical protein